MSISSLNNIHIVQPKSDIQMLKEQKPANLKAEKARLAKATKEFESFFFYQLMKTMRKTIPKSSFNEGGALSSGMGKDIFTDMFDMQLSKKMVNSGQNSISSMLYRSLEKIVEAPYLDNEKAVEIKPLNIQNKQQFKLSPKDGMEFDRSKDGIKIESKEEKFVPVMLNIKNDNILSRYGEYINAAAKDTSLDPALIISVIKAESNGMPNAVSSAGAKGLMQLIDSTASDYGVKEIFDPKENIMAGSRYLRDMLDKFGSVKLALAAYNAGPGNVMRHNGIPPFKETQNYINKVINSLNVITGAKNNNDAKEVK